MQKVLMAEQHWKVATVYEMVAADQLGVPRQQRAAFARKAKWFRMLARIAAKKEAAAILKERTPPEARPQAEPALCNGAQRPIARYETLAERLQRARTTAEAKQQGAVPCGRENVRRPGQGNNADRSYFSVEQSEQQSGRC
jgi:hypothetical protein